MTEAWLPVPGYEGLYEISSFGQLASLKCGRRLILRGSRTQGYALFSLYDGRRGRWYAYAHQLVMLAFVGPRPPGLEICHIDGISGNSRLDNLRYDTHSANLVDAVHHGTSCGKRRKLSAGDVIAIRSRDVAESLATTAAKFGISRAYVSNIVARRVWRHLACPSSGTGLTTSGV